VSSTLDNTDQRLIAMLRHRPRAGVSELSRRLELARGTVTSRLDGLTGRGVVVGFGPDIDPGAAGYGVVAFATLSISQGEHDIVIASLAKVPEVLEVYTITGPGDLLVKIVATGNEDLHRILQVVSALPQVANTETQLALATPLQRTVADLVAAELDSH
jgi:DNA-binding Lrp family transcriptional regulator